MDTPPPDPDGVYAAIEATLRATAQGRWFLGEFARRQRSADTQRLLDALTRLDRVMQDASSASDAQRPRTAPAPADPDPRPAAFARLDALSFPEKLALFS